MSKLLPKNNSYYMAIAKTRKLNLRRICACLIAIEAIALVNSQTAYAISQVSLKHQNSRDFCRQQGAKLMTKEQIKAAIAQAAKAWIKGDAEGFASLFLPDGEFIVPGDRWVGREQIHQAVLDYTSAYSEVKIDIRRIVVDGNCAFVEWHWEDKENATGKVSKADDAIAVDFQDGLISRWREYIDSTTYK
ncbi:MAG: nuclear transport factor 2 family protein [Xenococcaceae cyanobacterium]